MPAYWYRISDGLLLKEVTPSRPIGYSDYAKTPDIAVLPGPLEVCLWTGVVVVVDPARLADLKVRLRERIESKALLDVQEGVLVTPWGNFRVRRDDVDAYQMIALQAIYALQTSTGFSMTLRKADDTSVTVTAGQYMQFMALIGSRMAAKLSTRDTRLNQLAAATAEDLKDFVP